jgi:HAD superfamily hydrolase (TIGR01509 family)
VKSFRDVRVVLLDWDGTLLDSCAADRRAYVKMFRSLGIPWSLETYNHHYSPDWYQLFRAAGIPRSRWKEADRTWRRYYAREKPALLPGVRRVLRWLDRRFTLALVTSGNRARVMEQLRRLGLHRYFAVRVCSEDAPWRKPHPAPLRTAMRRLDAKPGECLYVGDTAEDVEMSRRAGVRVIGVLGPFPTHARLRAAGAAALISSLGELPALLQA